MPQPLLAGFPPIPWIRGALERAASLVRGATFAGGRVDRRGELERAVHALARDDEAAAERMTREVGRLLRLGGVSLYADIDTRPRARHVLLRPTGGNRAEVRLARGHVAVRFDRPESAADVGARTPPHTAPEWANSSHGPLVGDAAAGPLQAGAATPTAVGVMLVRARGEAALAISCPRYLERITLVLNGAVVAEAREVDLTAGAVQLTTAD